MLLLSPQKMPPLPSSALPLISPRTHLLALLGPDNAKPDEDGWFAADFCLLNRLFTGLGRTQAWFTSIDLNQVIQQYGPILHGNPVRPRKVVCSNIEQLSSLHRIDQDFILDQWLHYVTFVCNTIPEDDHILIMLFGHGSDEEESFSFSVGSETLAREQFGQIIDTVLIKNPNIKISILMSSCYSGGWAVDNRFNATILAAAKADQESNSVPRSASGRFAGGVFVQAVVNELLRTGSPSNKEIAYREWTENVRAEMDTLFAVGANPHFTARNNTWDCPYEEATGLPKNSYRERYNTLPIVPPNPESDNLASCVAGGSPIIGRLNALCRQYLFLRPGLDNKAKNIHISTLVNQCFHQGLPSSKPFTMSKVMFLASRLRHRIALAALAGWYVDALQLRPFRSFCMFVEHEWRRDASEARRGHYSQAYSAICAIGGMFPRGPMRSSEGFSKPKEYLAAAFADKGLDAMEVRRRLNGLREQLAIEQGILSL